MTARTLLLPNTEFSPSTRIRDAALIVSASLVLALAAQVRIHLPWTPVPVTAQTFAVGLIGMLLGSRRGAMAVLLYLAEGVAGLPFFAGLTFGSAILAGATGGYLMAMPLGAFCCGVLSERGWDASTSKSFVAMEACALLILALGTLWLWRVTGSLDRAFLLGFAPFVIGDAAKSVLAALALPSLWAIRRDR